MGKARLIFVAGPLVGTVFELREGETRIGREPGWEIGLHSHLVSRAHCMIDQESGHFRIRDLQSLNGTLVNGIPIREQLLEEGARIRVGSSEFLYQEKEEAASIPVSLREDPVSTSTIQLDPTEAA